MGYIRRPSYYKNFRCIGSACTDNCCIGWEIEIDADTLAYYQTVSGSFGEKLRASISLPHRRPEPRIFSWTSKTAVRCSMPVIYAKFTNIWANSTWYRFARIIRATLAGSPAAERMDSVCAVRLLHI